MAVSAELGPETPKLFSSLRSNANLTRELGVTAFRLKYTGSLLGYVWSLVKPLMLFGMMYLVFAVFLLKGRTQPGVSFPVELLVAVVVWTFFAEATATSISAIAGNGHIIRKAYFPRWILVVSATLSTAMTFVVNMVLLLVIGSLLGWFYLSWGLLAVPLLILELYVLILGIGMFLSSLFVSYRDLGHIWEIVSQLLFYGSAIVYPFALLGHYQKIVALSPTTQIIEDLRRALISPEIPWTETVLGSWFFVPFLIVLAILALGFFVFNRLSPHFGEDL